VLKPCRLIHHPADILQQVQHLVPLAHTILQRLDEVCQLRKYDNNCLAKQIMALLFTEGIF